MSPQSRLNMPETWNHSTSWCCFKSNQKQTFSVTSVEEESENRPTILNETKSKHSSCPLKQRLSAHFCGSNQVFLSYQLLSQREILVSLRLKIKPGWIMGHAGLVWWPSAAKHVSAAISPSRCSNTKKWGLLNVHHGEHVCAALKQACSWILNSSPAALWFSKLSSCIYYH